MAATIALIAHDARKDQMIAFVRERSSVLSRYRLIATGTTGSRVCEGTGLDVDCMLSGPMGGDTQIAARVVEGEVVAVIFLIDPLYAQPHEPDIRALLRVCDVHNVPIATNLATAEAVVARLAAHRVAHLIFNPVAGQNNPDRDLALIREKLESHIHLNVDVTEPETSVSDLTRAAVEAGSDLVIASGGDGTVSAVADELVNTGVPLAVIPRGTANAFASALGIPQNVQGACKTILTGTSRIIDVAKCNGQSMILLAGIGFEADVIETADREMKDRWGPLAYLWAGIQNFSESQQFDAEIEIEGEIRRVKSGAITIANLAPPTSILAQGFGETIPDDGLLEVTIGVPKNRLQSIDALASMVGAAMMKTEVQRDDIIRLRTSRIRVNADPLRKVVVDGEIVGTTPVEVECIPRGLTVISPMTKGNIWNW
ncbi:MAG: methylglyoxal synthase [Cyanobacteria bacterium SID2]|nr:methylglyoxal synthase [Cyanobacteria bacterium SID2]MBP0006300.1 methylglyoxal synthase [Cyanobacteria bacterium SBC]